MVSTREIMPHQSFGILWEGHQACASDRMMVVMISSPKYVFLSFIIVLIFFYKTLHPEQECKSSERRGRNLIFLKNQKKKEKPCPRHTCGDFFKLLHMCWENRGKAAGVGVTTVVGEAPFSGKKRCSESWIHKAGSHSKTRSWKDAKDGSWWVYESRGKEWNTMWKHDARY